MFGSWTRPPCALEVDALCGNREVRGEGNIGASGADDCVVVACRAVF